MVKTPDRKLITGAQHEQNMVALHNATVTNIEDWVKRGLVSPDDLYVQFLLSQAKQPKQ